MANWPQRPLNIIVEILVNGTWNDISDFVYERDDIQISGGSPDQSSKPTAAQMTLTLNNRDARFTPNNTSGPYYPYLQKSTRIRCSVNDSYNGTTYNGYRFWGAVTEWPPNSDISATDIFCAITANGPFRYVRQGGGEGSALTRYYNNLTGVYAPIAYWPAEEDNLSTIVGAGISGGTSMSVTGTPKWKTVSNFNGSGPIGVLNGSTWTGFTGSFGSSGNDVYSTPGTYQWVASTTSVTITGIGPGGGGGNGPGDGGGGGGLATGVFAVTPGKAYTFTIPAGGPGGLGSFSASNNGSPGAAALTFAADNGTITCNPGHGGSAYPNGSDGAGGTASFTGGTSGQAAFTGGAGGRFVVTLPFTGSYSGAGGGSSAGSAGAGNAGQNSARSNGNGGTAPTGGFAGGNGGQGPTGTPTNGGVGAGGGGGAYNGNTGYAKAGAAGGSAQLHFVYSSSNVPAYNVFRFIMWTPVHGGNNGKVLTRWLTGGTVARWDVLYTTGNAIQVKGYNSGNTLLFTSSSLTIGDATTAMISLEAVNSGSSVNYTLTAIRPGIGQKKIGTVTGTQATATIGNCSEVIVAPNGDITKTAMGHFSVQYALVDLTHVSAALDGHTSEMTVDRFIRLVSEEGMDGAEILYNEGADHWGFESGTQSWVGTNCALSSVTSPTLFPGFVVGNTGDLGSGQVNWWNWPADGTHSLSIAANGVGAVTARSPSGLSGQPVIAGDVTSAAIDVYTPTAVSGLSANIDFYNSSGTFLSSSTTALDTPTLAGEVQTVKVTTGSVGAPTNAAFFAISVTSSGTLTNGTTFYIDNVRVGPRMSAQTRKRLHDNLEEIKDLEQAFHKESKKLWGLGFRTRISLINQSVAVTLNYLNATLSDTPQPVSDILNVHNDVTVKRQKGGKVRVVQPGGPNIAGVSGSGKLRRLLKVVAEIDAQLLALANHILNIGTTTSERYPNITIDMTRPEIATLFNAIGSAGPGDYVQLTNLPAWYPSTTAKQLITGYSESLNAFKWTIVWNCVPELPFEITSTNLRRW